MAEVQMMVPKEYGCVALALLAYCFLNLWMAGQVGKARKKYKVFYPTLYASEYENKDAKLFNCVQRGHQDSPEMMPMFFVLMILGGFKHPCVCASLGYLYIISRYFYFTGYSTGDPQKRLSIGHPRMRARIELLLKQHKLTRNDVKDILQEYHDNIGDLDGPEEKERAQTRIQKFLSAF